jgi:hypothetical protein
MAMVNALRLGATAGLVVALLPALAPPARAGVKTEEKTRVELGGPLGGILKLFGGKGATEGVVTRTAVFGDRRLVAGPEAGQIVDLKEGAVYELDLKKKTYTVTTFAELRQRFEEQKAKAEAEAAKAQAKADKQQPQPAQPAEAKEFEVDFQASNTAERRTVAGHEARLVVLRATVHEKGRSVQQAGGLMFRNDLWLVPKLKELDELEAWNRRYALKMAEVYGAPAATIAVDQMAKLYGLYPGAQKAMEKMRAEMDKVDLEGTTVAATLTATAIKSAEQVAAAENDSMKADTGVTGFLAKQMFKKAAGDPADPRTMLLTSSHELLKLSPDATEADVALPAGFKRK